MKPTHHLAIPFLVPLLIHPMAHSQRPPTKKPTQSSQKINSETIYEFEEKLKKINAAIEVTKNRIKTQRESQFAPDLFFMLGELYHDKSMILGTLKKEKNPNTPDNELDSTQEKQLLSDAAEQFKLIEDRYPDYGAMDRVVFTLATEYKLLGEEKLAIETFKRVTQKFSQTSFASKAWLELGEIYMQKRDFEFAIEQFKNIEKIGKEPEKSQALHKIGLALTQLEKYKESLETFEKVYKPVDISQIPSSQLSIFEDALIASVWPLLELKPLEMNNNPEWRNPQNYYLQYSQDKIRYRKVLNRLAQRLEIKKREKESVQVYWELFRISDDTGEKKAAFESAYLGNKKLKITQFPEWSPEQLKNLILKMSSHLELPTYKNDISKYEVVLRDILTSLHKNMIVTKRKDELLLMADNYEDYLELYPNNPNAPLIRLNLAEALFHSEEYHRAGRFYFQVALGPQHKDIKKKEVLDSSLESYLKGSSDLKNPLLVLMQSRAGYRSSVTAYKKTYPTDSKIPDLEFNVAKIAYDEQNFNLAAKLFLDYLTKYPQHNKSKQASLLYLDCYYLRDQMKDMAAAGKNILKLPVSNEIKTSVQQAVNQAQLKAIRSIAGDFGSQNYAQKFREFARKNKNSQLGETALYEAYTSARSQNSPQAFELGEEYVATYPNTPRGKEIFLSLTQLSLTRFDYQRAGSYLAAFAQKYPNESQSKNFSEQAGLIFEMLGKTSEAFTSFEMAGNQSRGFLAAARIGDWSFLSDRASKINGLEGQYYQGLALIRQKNMQPGLRLLEQVTKNSGSNLSEKEMVAHAAVILAENLRKEFSSQGKGQPFSPQLLERKSQQYQAIINYTNLAIQSQGGKWILGALYNQGQANLEMAQFLKTTPPPPGLNPNQLKQMLLPQITSYEKTGLETLNKCFQVAEQNEFPTLYARACKTKQNIVELMDSEYYPKNLKSQLPQSVLDQLLKDPRNTESLKIQSGQLIKQGQANLAILLLSRAQEINSNDSEILSLQGAAFLNLKQSVLAQDFFKQALNKKQTDSLALQGLGGLAKQYGYLSQSTQYFKRASGTRWSGLHPWIGQ